MTRPWSSQLGLQNTLTSFMQSGNPPKKCPGYNTKQSDGEGPVILELWRLCSPLLPLLPGPLWPGVVVLSMGQVELTCTYAKLNCLR